MTVPAPADDQLLAARQAEAMALFAANQRARLAGWILTVLTVLLVVAAVLGAVIADRDEVLLVVAPATLVLQALSFQLYGDVTVIGAARAALEEAVNEALGAPALVYESYVAPIRKRSPLVASVRMLQAVVAGLALAAVVAGVVVAFDQEAATAVTFLAATLVTAIAAALSYRDMMRSWSVASADLAAALDRR